MARVLLVVLVTVGCGGDSTKPDATADGFDRSALLAHLGNQMLLPVQAAVATQTGALPAAVDAYCDALDAGAPGATLDAARAAWATAIDAWERADALLVGPAAMDNRAVRDRIYGWPLLSSCGLDRDTAASWANPAGYDVASRLANVRTLAAVEYLLYTTATVHTCATEPAGWAALGVDLPRARCRQALAIATDVAAQAGALHAAWRADGGDYVGELTRAGAGSSIATAHEGVNQVSDALFYVDRMVKDMKLAESAGIAINSCGTVGMPCLREVELPFADRATHAIRANLAALREVFTGSAPGRGVDGPGFDDFLRELGHADIADRMTGKLDDAIAKAAALPDSFLGALASDLPAVVALHGAVRLFTDDLKTQFLTVLALEIPDDVATDND